jgi:hypothetical protein
LIVPAGLLRCAQTEHDKAKVESSTILQDLIENSLVFFDELHNETLQNPQLLALLLVSSHFVDWRLSKLPEPVGEENLIETLNRQGFVAVD